MRPLFPLLVTLFALATSATAALDPPTAADLLATAAQQTGYHLDPTLYIKQHPTLPVLGYVTPWNNQGSKLVEEFRNKFDLVSPTWYTVHASDAKSKRSQQKYIVKGGAPSKDDEAWVRRLQKPLDAYHQPVGVVPRFLLDGWEQQDYIDLLSNSTRWSLLSSAIVDTVDTNNYDGVVFESSATYLLQEPLALLSSALHQRGKKLILVLPPLRTKTSLGVRPSRMFESQNAMILQSLPGLFRIADYFSIMTYDMTGPGGREARESGEDFPADSPLRKAKRGSLRQPGANTHPEWIRENLVAAIEASVGAEWEKRRASVQDGETGQMAWGENGGEDPTNPFPRSKDGQEADSETTLPSLSEVSRKFLMGLPMYGYTYPLFHLDTETGQGIANVRPGSAALYSSTTLSILRGAGRAVKHEEVLDLLRHYADEEANISPFSSSDEEEDDDVINGGGNGGRSRARLPTLLELEDDRGESTGESYFDYLLASSTDEPTMRVSRGDRVYWRAVIPTRYSQAKRIEAVLNVADRLALDDLEHPSSSEKAGKVSGGLALWEVGQAGRELLEAL